MKRAFLVGLIFFPFALFAQQSADEIALREDVGEELNELLQKGSTYKFENKLWCYLRFGSVPNAEQKDQLVKAHVYLHQYQPDLNWFASMPLDVDPNMLYAVGVRQVFVKPLLEKADQRIFRDFVPDYAKSGLEVAATVIVASSNVYDRIIEQLQMEDLSIVDVFTPLGILQVKGSENALISAAKLPFVIFVELPEPPAELEFEDEITLGRGACINGYYKLDGLTGDNITIAVNEGGIVDSLVDPNFKNRIDRTLEVGNTSGHKTGVGLRMASAGNINPIHRGEAWGAELVSGGINFTTAAQNNINIVNNSFGYGCIPLGPTYNSGAATNDFLVRTYERFMITYSCGNIGNSSCANYGAGAGWGNITGLVKSAKNIFAVGAMNTDDQLTGFSSRGPAMDGRILPDITAAGPGGTSHASPNLAGVNALLTEAYRNENSNQWPNSGLIKAIILNTADDIENPGPDYKTGFGRINATRALKVIEANQFMTDSIANGVVETHTINIPTGVSQLKISIYWNDHEATAGIMGKTLVNNLDLRVNKPSNAWVQPWVLNSFPHPDSLNLVATHSTDTLNNVELVTIDNPTSGNYTAEITGTLVPFGPQVYRVIYSFVYDSIGVVYPNGGEGLVPGESRRIRWDAFDTGALFDLEFSIDCGSTWQSITTGLASNIRSYNWTIPNSLSGNCLMKVKTAAQQDISSSRFTIAPPPTNLDLVWRCADSAIFSWDSVPGALGYRVYRLGNKYMDTASFTTNTFTTLYNLSANETEWVSVQTVLPDLGSGRRAIAITIEPGDFNCVAFDLSMQEIISPFPGYYADCIATDSMDVELRIKNKGVSSLSYMPIAFQLNGGNILNDTLFSTLYSAVEDVYVFPKAVLLQFGTNTLKTWSTYPGDGNIANDTMEVDIVVYSSSAGTLPYVQNFDNFTDCSTSWGCASVTCSLFQGWYNLPNIIGVDSIDWRTHSGATGTGGTGPASDHTTGSGKYLYLEGSGNGGSGCTNKEAKALMPCLDLSGTNNPTLSYWYHSYGSGIGSLHVDVLTEGKWHLDVAPPVIGQKGNQWIQKQTSLSAFIGKEITVRFRGRTGFGYASDLALDDINLSTLPLAAFETVYDSFCLGQSVPLQNPTTYGTSYKWIISPNTFTYTSGNDSSVTPIISPTDTGWYSVQLIANNSTGSDTLIDSKLFYVGSFDAPTLVSDGLNNTFCTGALANFSAQGIGSNYSFYIQNSLIQTGQSSTLGPLVASNGNSIHVENYINATCSISSASLLIKVQPDLNEAVLWSSDPDLTICAGDTVLMATQSGLTQYIFFQNSTVASTGPDSLFESYQLMDGDVVYCQLEDSIGCTGVSDSLLWTVNPIPATPSILPIGTDSLTCTVSGGSYAWWNNGQPLSFTTQSIPATSNRSYEVVVSDFGCPSEISEPITYGISGILEQENSEVRIYPNPASNTVFVDLENASFNKVKLIDNTGRILLTQNVNLGENTLRIESLAAGTYTIQLISEKSQKDFILIVL